MFLTFIPFAFMNPVRRGVKLSLQTSIYWNTRFLLAQSSLQASASYTQYSYILLSVPYIFYLMPAGRYMPLNSSDSFSVSVSGSSSSPESARALKARFISSNDTSSLRGRLLALRYSLSERFSRTWSFISSVRVSIHIIPGTSIDRPLRVLPAVILTSLLLNS